VMKNGFGGFSFFRLKGGEWAGILEQERQGGSMGGLEGKNETSYGLVQAMLTEDELEVIKTLRMIRFGEVQIVIKKDEIVHIKESRSVDLPKSKKATNK